LLGNMVEEMVVYRPYWFIERGRGGGGPSHAPGARDPGGCDVPDLLLHMRGEVDDRHRWLWRDSGFSLSLSRTHTH
jgi:hypothetical protein